MEACADLKQRGDASASLDCSCRWGCNAAQKLEECRFACTILADDAYNVALLNLEVYVAQSIYKITCALGSAVVGLTHL